MESTSSGSEPGSVIVGVDGSESARDAALWAASEATRRERGLHMLYAAEMDGQKLYTSAESIEQVRTAGRALLDEKFAAVLEQHPGLDVSTELSRSAPAPSLLHRSAGPHGTIAVGSRGPCPVQLIPRRAREQEGAS
ncbi:universal stress protein [Streptomyces sp. H39-S7]|uniref:universal stress protein n=1 Tax=Streptomyces sp. H39-S7 TaxID=3004357 RepID=UPI0022AF1DAF|nr:universal stress protein [Streptomyces sp. H39-S7]MCZ4122756.1 universal stress protein [Streptomyces sp. H39-S7]